MMSSQLGRIVLGVSGSSADEMNATPDPDGGYGDLDGMLAEIAAEIRAESPAKGGRRPGRQSSANGPAPVTQPSR